MYVIVRKYKKCATNKLNCKQSVLYVYTCKRVYVCIHAFICTRRARKRPNEKKNRLCTNIYQCTNIQKLYKSI